MAQHISILNTNLKKYQNIKTSIMKRFQKNLKFITALNYEEILDDKYKTNEFDRVFLNYRKLNGCIEIFEIHYDTQKKRISEIYLVK